VSKLECGYCLVTHTLYSCTSINTNCLRTHVWISIYHQDVKIVAPGLPCDPHLCSRAQILRQIVYKPKSGSICGIRNDQCPVPFTPLSTRYINVENYHSYNFPSIVFTLKPTSLTSLLTNIHLTKHNKRQYKPHLKWGDLYKVESIC